MLMFGGTAMLWICWRFDVSPREFADTRYKRPL